MQEAVENEARARDLPFAVAGATVAAAVLVLVLVLELAAEDGSSNSTNETMPHLVASEGAGSSTSQCTH